MHVKCVLKADERVEVCNIDQRDAHRRHHGQSLGSLHGEEQFCLGEGIFKKLNISFALQLNNYTT